MPFRANCLQNSFVEKDLENLVENKLSRSQKCALMTKKAKESLAVLGVLPASGEMWSFPSTHLCVVLGSLVPDRNGATGEGQVKGYRGD